MDKGLIKGGSLENAVVVRGEQRAEQGAAAVQAMSSCGTRFSTSSATSRSSAGAIKGHVIAVKPGHGPNTELARAIAKQFAQAMALVPPSVTPKGGDVLDVNDVMKLLPHRYPVPDGGSDRVDRGRDEMHRREDRDDQRAVFPGPFPRPPDHARRAAARSDGAGRQHPAAAASRATRGRSATS